MNLISPTGVEVNIGETLKPDEYIGMTRREILDGFLRDRAIEYGAVPINALVTSIDIPEDHKTSESQYTINYQEYQEGSSAGIPKSMKVDLIVGADGANSRVAKAMDAGQYKFAIAFQERIKIPDDNMEFYEEMAEMYVGDDVSPDFYGWVFPKYDHVGVGTGTVVNRPAIKQYQKAIRDRAGDKIAGFGIAELISNRFSRLPHLVGDGEFDDPSGDRLRSWMGVDRETFYDASRLAVVPMGFCYPGTGKGGDLPPRAECAEAWRARLRRRVIGWLQARRAARRLSFEEGAA